MQNTNLGPTSVAASTTVANALSGTPIEFLGAAVVLTVYGNASATGLQISLFGNQGDSSSVFIAPGSALGAASTPGNVKTNEDYIGQFAVPAGTRLVLQIVNTTTGALSYQFKLQAG